MKDRQFFENLDTSFIKLDALVKYLNRRSFVGSIYIKFAGYSGEITLTPERKLRVREQDHVAGVVTGGERAFDSIISRSKEPGGIVNVVQSIKDLSKPQTPDEGLRAEPENVVNISNGKLRSLPSTPIMRHLRIEPTIPEKPTPPARGTLSQLADFPFDLSNHFEDRGTPEVAANPAVELMTDVTADLLSTIDNALKRAGLDFASALEKACGEIKHKHPMLDPSKRIFRYSQGLVYIRPDTDLDILAEGLTDALIRIFDRLNSARKFGKVYRFTVQKVRQLLLTRDADFEQAGLATHLRRIISFYTE